MEEVRVSIDDEGNVKVTVFGARGPRCLEVTEKLEAMLGGELEREFTSEYYQVEEEEKQRQKLQDRE